MTILATFAWSRIRPLAALAVELHCPCGDDADQPPPGDGVVPNHYTIRVANGCALGGIFRAEGIDGKASWRESRHAALRIDRQARCACA
ncbi:MAG: hypothetical protein HUU22_04695 [Phycisphaerae bacterium]|nr:hypothetical protein [Phycisphaerae bacterium]